MLTIVTAVIVTHNPPDGMVERLEAVLNQIDRVVVVDNGSGDALTLPHDDRIAIIRNEENKGLAVALNQGIQHALISHANWVLLLDHDSTPEPGMVTRMLTAYQAYSEKDRIGLIAPEIKDENTTEKTRYLISKGKFSFQRMELKTPYNDEVLSVITSGSLIKAPVFKDAGVMPEHFFIDYIDYAFCLSLKKAGYNILLVRGAVLQHRLGDKKEHGIAGAKVITSNHSAERPYTIFRNRVWLWKRYAAVFPGFVMHDVLAAGFDVLRITFCEKEKGQKLKAVLRGIRAGLRGEPV